MWVFHNIPYMVVSAHLGDFTAGLSLAGVFGGGDILYVILCYWDLCVYTKNLFEWHGSFSQVFLIK